MRIFVWASVFLLSLNLLIYSDFALDKLSSDKLKYKRALDSATYAAAKYRAYDSEQYINNLSDSNNENLLLDKQQMLQWFYKIFYRNIGVSDEYGNKNLKKYIVVKCIIAYDKMYITNKNDEWQEIEYEVEYNDKQYKLTLGDKVYVCSSKTYVTCKDINLTISKKQQLITDFIKSQFNNMLNIREIIKNKGNYYVDFGQEDMDKNMKINGINFLAFVEGMPIQTLGKTKKIYALSFSGAEIVR